MSIEGGVPLEAQQMNDQAWLDANEEEAKLYQSMNDLAVSLTARIKGNRQMNQIIMRAAAEDDQKYFQSSIDDWATLPVWDGDTIIQ